jgi:L-threonylcarbamoyladenylate synthase
MLKLAIDPFDPEGEPLRRAADVLARGGVVVFPTDTFYGLAANPRDQAAVERVYQVKGRDFRQPLPLVAADAGQVSRDAGILSPLALRLAGLFWPGPLTLLIEALPSLPAAVHAGTGKIAVRVPDHAVSRGLCRVAGHPLTSTSANRSGAPPSAAPGKAVEGIAHMVDLLLDAGPTPGGLPSTIVDVTSGQPELVRSGALSWVRVLESLEEAE